MPQTAVQELTLQLTKQLNRTVKHTFDVLKDRIGRLENDVHALKMNPGKCYDSDILDLTNSITNLTTSVQQCKTDDLKMTETQRKQNALLAKLIKGDTEEFRAKQEEKTDHKLEDDAEDDPQSDKPVQKSDDDKMFKECMDEIRKTAEQIEDMMGEVEGIKETAGNSKNTEKRLDEIAQKMADAETARIGDQKFYKEMFHEIDSTMKIGIETQKSRDATVAHSIAEAFGKNAKAIDELKTNITKTIENLEQDVSGIREDEKYTRDLTRDVVKALKEHVKAGMDESHSDVDEQRMGVEGDTTGKMKETPKVEPEIYTATPAKPDEKPMQDFLPKPESKEEPQAITDEKIEKVKNAFKKATKKPIKSKPKDEGDNDDASAAEDNGDETEVEDEL